VAEGGSLLNADQHFGHRRFSSQILTLITSSIDRVGCCLLRKLDVGSWQGQFQQQLL
jgi:hypothetical protein